MKKPLAYILVGHESRAASLYEWSDWFVAAYAERIVAQTTIGDVKVSTCFVGIGPAASLHDGPPLLFETRVFGGGRGGVAKAATWAEAERAHGRMVEYIRDGALPHEGAS